MASLMGEEGFRWFFGVIEDREDPKKIGRVRVRIYNVHPFDLEGNPDKAKVPTDDLPWAMPINTIISAGLTKTTESVNDGIGMSPTGLMVGSTVFGFFADGNECQMPLILGTLAGIVGEKEQNETPKTSQGINATDIKKNSLKIPSAAVFPGEPPSPFAAKYPYNKSFRSESGHLIEIDDTPGKERLHQFHTTGTYTEVDHTGQQVVKVVDDRFDITVKDNNVYVGGKINLYVGSDVNIHIVGNETVNIIGNKTVNITGEDNITVGGNVKMQVNGNYEVKATGDISFETPGGLRFAASRVDIT